MNWVDQSSGETYTDNPLTLQVEGDLSLEAVFERIQYELDVEIIGQGEVRKEVINSSKNDYDSGSKVNRSSK